MVLIANATNITNISWILSTCTVIPNLCAIPTVAVTAQGCHLSGQQKFPDLLLTTEDKFLANKVTDKAKEINSFIKIITFVFWNNTIFANKETVSINLEATQN